MYFKFVINQVEVFLYCWENLSSENLVAMLFFFCNTHHVVAAAHFLWRGWIWICCSAHSPGGVTERPESVRPFTSPLGLVEWMTMSRCGGRVLADGLLVWWRIAAVPVQRRSHHRRSRKRSRSFEDDDEGHLIYHNGDMLKARCTEYTLFFFSLLLITLYLSLFLSLWLSGYFQTLT